MSIQFKLFTLSVRDAVENEARLNLFLRQHRVLNVHREFVQDKVNSHWSLLVEYLSDGGVLLHIIQCIFRIITLSELECNNSLVMLIQAHQLAPQY